MNRNITFAVCIASAVLNTACVSNAGDSGVMEAQTVPSGVRLLKGSLFADSQETGLEYVLRLDPDRLMAPVCKALGHTAEASLPYGGWESQQIAGHSLGHYLSALSGFVYETGSTEAEEKLDYTVEKLKNIQRADGYLSAVPSSVFETAARGGQFHVERFNLCGWWVPWYSTHKIYAGLIDAYVYGGNKDALAVVQRMCDWAVALFKDTDDASFQRMLYCEHGGMCKVFADMYGITGKKEYLTMAERFIDHEMMDPAMHRIDNLQGHHANTQIPKFIGLARLYELTGKEEYRTGAEFFFRTVTERRSYVIGGNSIGEHFGPEYEEKLGRNTCETCNTYNMLELAEHICSWQPSAHYAQFYETALYNHILASQDPANGNKMYFVSMDRGHFKVYGTPETAFWCCTGTGMENPERYNRFIWQKKDSQLYLNLFIPSVYKNGGTEFVIETKFPYSTKVKVTAVSVQSGSQPVLNIRVPEWTDGTLTVKKNGTAAAAEKTGEGYIRISDTLCAGDVLTFELPMKLRIRETHDESGNFSILYGPLVLAAELGTEGYPSTDTIPDQLALMTWPGIKVPDVTGNTSTPEKWIKETDPSSLTFTVNASAVTDAGGKKRTLTLKPFFAVNHERYAVYFCASEKQKTDRNALYASDTFDSVEPGRQQPEIDHSVQSSGSSTGYIDSIDASWRDAHGNGSYFEYTMKFSTEKKNTLLVAYYDKDGPVGNSPRKFMITLNGEKLADVELNGTGRDELVDAVYPVPEELVKKYAQAYKKYAVMKVRFIPADSNCFAGGIMDLRVLAK